MREKAFAKRGAASTEISDLDLDMANMSGMKSQLGRKRCFPRTLTRRGGLFRRYRCSIDGNKAPEAVILPFFKAV
jgi:hypothetical protein